MDKRSIFSYRFSGVTHLWVLASYVFSYGVFKRAWSQLGKKPSQLKFVPIEIFPTSHPKLYHKASKDTPGTWPGFRLDRRSVLFIQITGEQPHGRYGQLSYCLPRSFGLRVVSQNRFNAHQHVRRELFFHLNGFHIFTDLADPAGSGNHAAHLGQSQQPGNG